MYLFHHKWSSTYVVSHDHPGAGLVTAILLFDTIGHFIFDNAVYIANRLHRTSDRRLTSDIIVVRMQRREMRLYPGKNLPGLMKNVGEVAFPRQSYLGRKSVLQVVSHNETHS